MDIWEGLTDWLFRRIVHHQKFLPSAVNRVRIDVELFWYIRAAFVERFLISMIFELNHDRDRGQSFLQYVNAVLLTFLLFAPLHSLLPPWILFA